MAVNIFDKYGIKEVANVYFEALDDDEAAGVYKGDIVLFLDTLKVSTIETTAENTAAQGGWGNPKLIQWDYGKEINITLEDALMSLESLRFMLGGAIKRPGADSNKIYVRHTEEVVCGSNGEVRLPEDHLTGQILHPVATYEHPIRLINLTTGARTQLVAESKGATIALTGEKPITFKNPSMISGKDHEQVTAANDHIRIFWEEEISTEAGKELGSNSGVVENAVEVTISPSTFPGTYRVIGDTFIRSEKTGKNEAFQFIINKAKVASEVTLTLEAEGDPTTFEMTLNVLRSTNDAGKDEMMKLVRYTITKASSGIADNDYGSIPGGS